MELRKTVKRPKRYDPDVPDSPEDAAYTPTKRSTLKIPFLDYNPNLPPAAFPTLDSLSHALSENHKETNTGHPQNNSSNSSSDSRKLSTSQSTTTTMPTLSKRNAMSRSEVWSRPTSPSVDYGQYPEASNGLENPTYAKNIELMRKLSNRTSQEWTVQEMETSDEDEPSNSKAGLKNVGNSKAMSRDGRDVEWDDLAIVHKLDIVDTLEEESASREEAMVRLGLTMAQRDEIDEHDVLRQRQLADEDINITALQNEVTETMLGYRGGSTKVTQTNYRIMLDKYLSEFVDADLEDYAFSTASEISKAKEFLSLKKLDPALVGEWDMGGPRGRLTKENKPTIENSSDQIPSALASKCAFPTIPMLANMGTMESPGTNSISKITGKPTRQYKKKASLPSDRPSVLAPSTNAASPEEELPTVVLQRELISQGIKAIDKVRATEPHYNAIEASNREMLSTGRNMGLPSPEVQTSVSTNFLSYVPYAEVRDSTGNSPDAAVVEATKIAASEKPSKYRQLLTTFTKERSPTDINGNGGSGDAANAQEQNTTVSPKAGASETLAQRKKRTYAERKSSNGQTESKTIIHTGSGLAAEPGLLDEGPPRKKRAYGKEAGLSMARTLTVLAEPTQITESNRANAPIVSSSENPIKSGVELAPKGKPDSAKGETRTILKKEPSRPKQKNPNLLVKPAYRGTARG